MSENADYAKEAVGPHLSETFNKSVHPLGNLEPRVRGHLSIVNVGIKKHARREDKFGQFVVQKSFKRDFAKDSHVAQDESLCK
jgi:hypothetical protein